MSDTVAAVRAFEYVVSYLRAMRRDREGHREDRIGSQCLSSADGPGTVYFMRWMSLSIMLVLIGGVARAQPVGATKELTATQEVELTVQELRHASVLFNSTLSPFCPGRTLSSCPSGKATKWRRDIRAWVAEGLNDEEILARLQARAPGFQLEGTPPTDWSWAGPLMVMMLLTLAFLIGSRRALGSKTASTESPRASEGDSSYRRQLEEELRQID